MSKVYRFESVADLLTALDRRVDRHNRAYRTDWTECDRPAIESMQGGDNYLLMIRELGTQLARFGSNRTEDEIAYSAEYWDACRNCWPEEPCYRIIRGFDRWTLEKIA